MAEEVDEVDEVDDVREDVILCCMLFSALLLASSIA